MNHRRARRRVPRLAAALALALFAGALPERVACACSCGRASLSQHTQWSDVAFVGTATATRIEVAEVVRPGGPTVRIPYSVTTFRVERQWKGQPQAILEVRSSTETSICGYIYQPGTRYVVFATFGEDATGAYRALGSGLCSTFRFDQLERVGGLDPAIPIGRACPGLEDRVPTSALVAALGEPERYAGWWQPAHPSRPPGPFNPPRTWLSLRTSSKPYGPMNPLVWKAGCP